MSKVYRKRLLWLCLFTTFIRIVAALSIDLGNDEVYYYTYAQQPDWNYFDHPPMVGLLIRLFTVNLEWVNTFSMRLGAIVCSLLCTWLIAAIGTLIKNERTGYIAAVMYSASIYASVIAGLFILPDSPAVVCWLAALYCMVKVIMVRPGYSETRHFIFTGIWIGLAMMSKVHGVFLWVGWLGFIILYQRKLLRDWRLYTSLLLSMILVVPILAWNIQYDFITWRFHGERVTVTDSGFQPSYFIAASAGQIFYNNPLLVILYTCAVIAVFKLRRFLSADLQRLLLLCGLPIIAATLIVSLFRQVLPHWSGPGFLALILLTAAWAEEKISLRAFRWRKKMLNAALLLWLVVVMGGIVAVNYFPGTLSAKPAPQTGKGDITLDMYRWSDLVSSIDSLRQADVRQSQMRADAPLVVNKWFPAGHLLFYVARPLDWKVTGIGTMKELHQFAWLNQQQGLLHEGSDAYFISCSNYFQDPVQLYKDAFFNISPALTLPQFRGGRIARYWYVYRMKGAKKELGLLPR